jgi:hypothetical protein
VAKRYADTQDEMIKFDEDIDFLRCSCDSVRLRTQADLLFDSCLNDAEEVNFDMMWDILDTYKAASLACREKDIENEAIAISRQARLFDKMFKLGIKAKENYRAAFDLAQCLHPKDLSKCGWFKETKNGLERYQRNVWEEEQRQKDKEKAPYLEKMKGVLAEIKSADMK